MCLASLVAYGIRQYAGVCTLRLIQQPYMARERIPHSNDDRSAPLTIRPPARSCQEAAKVRRPERETRDIPAAYGKASFSNVFVTLPFRASSTVSFLCGNHASQNKPNPAFVSSIGILRRRAEFVGGRC